MPPEEPVTPHEQHVAEDPSTHVLPDAYEPLEEQDDWPQERDELPRRPRRRLLSPVPLALLGVLLIACGFIAGVLVEKGQSTAGASAGAPAGLAARFAALRAGTPGAGGSSAGSSAASAGAAAGGAAAGGASGAGAGFAGLGAGRGTVGQVAYLSGDTLYVTTSEGNTVKVDTSAATNVQKTVGTSVKAIHPGETVTVTGSTAADGTLTAESIRVGAGGALAALLGAAGGSTRPGGGARGGTGGAGASGGGAGEPQLFGSG